MKKVLIGLVVCTLALVACSSNLEKYQATLEGSQVVPAVDTDAFGEVSVALNTKKTGGGIITSPICVCDVIISGNVNDLSSKITAAHLHKGAVGRASRSTVFLIDIDISNVVTGKSARLRGKFSAARDHIDDLRSGDWHIDVHTEDNPSGEIRGQVVPK